MTFDEWVSDILLTRSSQLLNMVITVGVIVVSVRRWQRHPLVSALAAFAALGFLGLHSVSLGYSYVMMTGAVPYDSRRVLALGVSNLISYLNLVFGVMVWTAMFISRRPVNGTISSQQETVSAKP